MSSRWPWLAVALAAATSACNVGTDETTVAPPPPADEWDQKLDARVVDYGAALRIAALRLTGELPTLGEMSSVTGAADPKAAYAAQIHTYMSGPKFARQMFHWWQDTMKMGDAPELDTAPAFAAQLTVENRPITDLFTATTGTCPTLDATTGTFTAHDCANGTTASGVLTNPGAMKLFFSNFGFRRVRWVQEVFICSAFPAEVSTVGQDVHGATPYTGLFPFDSVATLPAGAIDFQNKDSQLCANCHSNINHIAPLLGHFDENGQYQPAISVPSPAGGLAQMKDYLKAGEPTGWRHDKPAADIPALGHAIAADPAATSCVISRAWNWAMGKSDIVDGGNRVPSDTIATVMQSFTASNYKLKDALYQIFTSDDFVRF